MIGLDVFLRSCTTCIGFVVHIQITIGTSRGQVLEKTFTMHIYSGSIYCPYNCTNILLSLVIYMLVVKAPWKTLVNTDICKSIERVMLTISIEL